MANKRCSALTFEEYKMSIDLLCSGFVLDGVHVRPNIQVASICVLEACMGLPLGDVLALKMNSFTKSGSLSIVRQGTDSVKVYDVQSECFSMVKGYACKYGKGLDDYLFTITARQVQRQLNKVFRYMGLSDSYSSNSFKKSYKSFEVYDISLVNELLQFAYMR